MSVCHLRVAIDRYFREVYQEHNYDGLHPTVYLPDNVIDLNLRMLTPWFLVL